VETDNLEDMSSQLKILPIMACRPFVAPTEPGPTTQPASFDDHVPNDFLLPLLSTKVMFYSLLKSVMVDLGSTR
jgi:hypothetical protein